MPSFNEGQTPQNVLLFVKEGSAIRIVTSADLVGGGGNPLGDTAVNTGTASSVASSASAGTVLASNTARYGATVWNDSTSVLYLLLGAGTVSATNCTTKILADGFFAIPFGYTGIISGIWAVANGFARVTEFT
jgi:hypothetical protein